MKFEIENRLEKVCNYNGNTQHQSSCDLTPKKSVSIHLENTHIYIY